MQLSYTGQKQRLRDAVIFVNALNGNEQFWRDIRDRPRFDYSDWSGQRIERELSRNHPTVGVKLYTPSNPNVNAATDPRYAWRIFYSRLRTGRSVGRIVNTLVHEFVHNVDLFGDGASTREMGHGDNSPTGKEYSAPWWIGALAQSYYDREVAGLVADDEKDEDFAEEFEIDPQSLVDEPETPLGEKPEDLQL